MKSIKEKISKFMYKRYGMDELNTFLIYCYIILIFINIVIESIFIKVIELIIIVIIIIRMFSKDIYKRNMENRKYCDLKRKILKPFKMVKNKEYIYKKCHYCKTILKFKTPKKVGIKHSICPECKNRNTYLILKKKK